MVKYYKKWKKYNEIQLTKNKMDLNIRKMTNHPPSPEGDDIHCIIRHTVEFFSYNLDHLLLGEQEGYVQKHGICWPREYSKINKL